MYSSRMRAARLLPISPSMHCGGCLLGGRGYLLPGGVCFGGVSGPGGCLPIIRDVYPSMQWGKHPPCGQTDTCENITFANFVCGRQKLLKTIELGDFIENLFEGFVHSARTVSTIPLIESSYSSRCEIPGKHYDI